MAYVKPEEEKKKKKKVELPVVTIKTTADYQRMKLERLMANPDKPVNIPERPKDKSLGPPPEFVRNIMGSSAGAGSGEFHVYRHLRRKEYARQKYIQEKAKADEKHTELVRKREEAQKALEEKSERKRKKRLKKKKMAQKKKRAKGQQQQKSSTESSSSSSSESESEQQELAEKAAAGSAVESVVASQGQQVGGGSVDTDVTDKNDTSQTSGGEKTEG